MINKKNNTYTTLKVGNGTRTFMATTDLTQFEYFANNRPILSSKVKGLFEEMLRIHKEHGAHEAFSTVMAVVELPNKSGVKSYFILDGQHRLDSAFKMKNNQSPIPIVCEIKNYSDVRCVTEMRGLNTTGHNWTLPHYVSSYINHPNKAIAASYRTIEEVKKKYNIQYCNINQVATGRKDLENFKQGKTMLKAGQFATQFRQISEYRQAGLTKAFYLRNLIPLMMEKGYNHGTMLMKVKKAFKNGTLNLQEVPMAAMLRKFHEQTKK